VPAQQPLQGLGVVVGVADHGGPMGRAATQPSQIVLWARESTKIVPSEASTGITEAWMWVRVGSSRVSAAPSSSVSRVSICRYRAGLPSIRDQLGWVPQRSRKAGIAPITSRSRSRPR
jgi:hypothetical protein